MDAAHQGSSSAAGGEAPTTGEHRMGTTIVGVCYNGGVVLGADSRTSTEGMSQEEAEKFVVKAVSLAMARDGASGGVVRTVTINADGVKRNFYPGDTLELWHEELKPHSSLLDILAAGSPGPMVQ
nr:unnamed protein product [Digitaria exilis]